MQWSGNGYFADQLSKNYNTLVNLVGSSYRCRGREVPFCFVGHWHLIKLGTCGCRFRYICICFYWNCNIFGIIHGHLQSLFVTELLNSIHSFAKVFQRDNSELQYRPTAHFCNYHPSLENGHCGLFVRNKWCSLEEKEVINKTFFLPPKPTTRRLFSKLVTV